MIVDPGLRRGGGLAQSLRRGLIADVDFLTGRGRELLTVTSTTGHNGTIGPRIPDHTGAYVPCPSGLLKGWRGIRVLSGIAGSPPAGWQAEANGSPYWSLGGGWGMSWRNASGAPLGGVQWWGPQPATTENAQNSMAPGSWTLAFGARASTTDATCPLPAPHLAGPNAGTTQVSEVWTTATSTTDGYIWVIAKASTASWLLLDARNLTNTATWYNVTAGTIGTVAASASGATITALGGGWWLCGHRVTGATTQVRVRVVSADANTGAWTTAAGTERIAVAYLGCRTRADFGFPIETGAAAVTVNAETVTVPFAPGAGDWTTVVNGPNLAENETSFARFVGTASGTYINRGGTNNLQSFGGGGAAANANGMITAGVRKLGSRRAAGAVVFIADGTVTAATMTGYDPTNLNTQTQASIGGSPGGTNTFNGRISRVRLWNRALTDAEFRAA